MKAAEAASIIGLGLFIYVEFFRAQPAVLPNNPANANALGTPSAGVSPSTLTPMQLGSGLFENQSGLQTSPGVLRHAA